MNITIFSWRKIKHLARYCRESQSYSGSFDHHWHFSFQGAFWGSPPVPCWYLGWEKILFDLGRGKIPRRESWQSCQVLNILACYWSGISWYNPRKMAHLPAAASEQILEIVNKSPIYLLPEGKLFMGGPCMKLGIAEHRLCRKSILYKSKILILPHFICLGSWTKHLDYKRCWHQNSHNKQ